MVQVDFSFFFFREWGWMKCSLSDIKFDPKGTTSVLLPLDEFFQFFNNPWNRSNWSRNESGPAPPRPVQNGAGDQTTELFLNLFIRNA